MEIDEEYLKQKMKEAINYQFVFGTTQEDRIERASENCAKIALQLVKKLKTKELILKK